jgi:hypothetical protein
VTTSPAERPTVLCALEFERSILSRATWSGQARIECCGPGAESVVRWSEQHGATRNAVILCGLAGGLRASAPARQAFLVSTVITAAGRQHRSQVEPATHGDDSRRTLRRAVLTSVSRIVATPAEKQALAEKSGAELVDLESGVFAEAAGVFGWRWAIVRGVSDGSEVALPAQVGAWIDSRGRTRTTRVAIDVLTKPWIVPSVLRLRANSIAAMRAVTDAAGRVLAGMMNEGSASWS